MDAKKRLLSTAANLIHSKGFNSTSVQDILDETAVARSNFYYHFDSKEQLAFEVLGRNMRWWYSYVLEPSLDNNAVIWTQLSQPTSPPVCQSADLPVAQPTIR